MAGSQLRDSGKPKMRFGEAAITRQVLGSRWRHRSLAAGLGCAGPLPDPKISVPGPAFDPGLVRLPFFDPFAPLLSAVAALLATGSGK